jgi:hypothetical protein
LGLFEALKPPLDERGLLGVVPELSLSRRIEQSAYTITSTPSRSRGAWNVSSKKMGWEPASREICRRLGLSAPLTDLAAILTALHLKMGFMKDQRTDYIPDQARPRRRSLRGRARSSDLGRPPRCPGSRLKRERLERHRELCVRFLCLHRDLGVYPEPDYEGFAEKLPPNRRYADLGYAGSHLRLLVARSMEEKITLLRFLRLS